ncbi:hypothetical protein HaLaN_32114 [Haematococcus lacustris]|uniref:Uncharacterized protein n=1 Tax=Haematococcus lacustris TaxID=44745 RepID=A0A6A0AM14_HAELA|nr:hypothetical protein HaLaN_32114 [Haematococcus lacustris]
MFVCCMVQAWGRHWQSPAEHRLNRQLFTEVGTSLTRFSALPRVPSGSSRSLPTHDKQGLVAIGPTIAQSKEGKEAVRTVQVLR